MNDDFFLFKHADKNRCSLEKGEREREKTKRIRPRLVKMGDDDVE